MGSQVQAGLKGPLKEEKIFLNERRVGTQWPMSGPLVISQTGRQLPEFSLAGS